jgi:hypothetical protein
MSARRARILAALSLAALTVLVYSPSFFCGFVDYDDPSYVTENPVVLSGLSAPALGWAFGWLQVEQTGNWHPLAWISLQLDAELYGPRSAWGFHLTNVLLHVSSTLLLFWILERTTGAVWPSALVAALFAWHPLHVESVAWIAERKDVLSGLFWMLTIAAYVRYVERPSAHRYLLVLVLFALGLMAKSMLVTLPVVLCLLDYWPLGRVGAWRVEGGGWRVERGGRRVKGEGWTEEQEKSRSRHHRTKRRQRLSPSALHPPPTTLWLLLEKAPLFLLALLASTITLVAQDVGGAVKSFTQYPIEVRFANALTAYVLYLGKACWPAALAVHYPHSGLALLSWQAIGALVLLTGLTVMALLQARRRPYLLVGWLWYLGTLVPVIGFVQLGDQAVADRYTYLPLIGLFIIWSWGAAELAARWQLTTGAALLSAVVLLAFLTCTWQQVHHWRDSVSLWRHALAVTRNNLVAHMHLGVELGKRGQPQQAIEHFQECLRINPRSADAHVNWGIALEQQGKVKEAIMHYKEALRIQPGICQLPALVEPTPGQSAPRLDGVP